MTVSIQKLMAWQTGNPVYNQVSSTPKQVLWKSGARIQRGFTISWDVGHISKQFSLLWNTTNENGQQTGVIKATFWGKHTGEQNSGQVIRFRNSQNPNIIVFESAVESNPKGFVVVNVYWKDVILQNQIAVQQYLYSDMNLVTNKWNIIRPETYLAPSQFPVYVTQEYKSTTDFKYMIRYLGFITNNPLVYQNGPLQVFKMDDQARDHGVSILHPNNSTLNLNVRIRLTDGTTRTGILPPGAAIALLKVDDKRRKIGYIPAEGLSVMPGPGVSLPVSTYQSYFKNFQ